MTKRHGAPEQRPRCQYDKQQKANYAGGHGGFEEDIVHPAATTRQGVR